MSARFGQANVSADEWRARCRLRLVNRSANRGQQKDSKLINRSRVERREIKLTEIYVSAFMKALRRNTPIKWRL